jgi:hypothetical protein
MTDDRLLYLDCFAGISGDMFLGLLLDLGCSEASLREGLARLALPGWQLTVHRDPAGPIAATGIEVAITGPQPRRTWQEIRDWLAAAPLPDSIRARALAVFKLLAAAEARVHGCTPDEIHFHEVGATDAIIDIVGTAIGLDILAIDRILCSPLPMPHGQVECAHGLLPLPAPAVCELLKGAPVYGVELEQELVTPTGAALVRQLAEGFGPMPPMLIEQVGYGRGRQELGDGRPNLLRGVIGRSRKASEAAEVEVISCNLDDWSPEGFPFLSEKLFSLGVLDVILIPVQMKKGRPGFLLQVICRPGEGWEAQRLILTETTSIGLRFHREERWTLPRRLGTVATPLGRIRVKLAEAPNGPVLYPEYEDCRRLALETGRPLKAIYAAVNRCRPEDFEEDQS